MNPKSGFTLIELLLVISRIMLLLALLIPTMAQAKENAGLAFCAANLHQILITIHAYSTDAAGILPSYRYPAELGGFAQLPFMNNQAIGGVDGAIFA